MTYPPYAYKRGPSRGKRPPNPESEDAIQASVIDYLDICLPPEVMMSATLNGIRLTPAMISKAKKQGLKRGPLDLAFVAEEWDGRTKWVEMKTATGTLTVEQRGWIKRVGVKNCAVCRSLDEVVTALVGWGVQLKAHPFGVGTRF